MTPGAAADAGSDRAASDTMCAADGLSNLNNRIYNLKLKFEISRDACPIIVFNVAHCG
jgi:hypothetical protein